jgi:hypothetical protein
MPNWTTELPIFTGLRQCQSLNGRRFPSLSSISTLLVLLTVWKGRLPPNALLSLSFSSRSSHAGSPSAPICNGPLRCRVGGVGAAAPAAGGEGTAAQVVAPPDGRGSLLLGPLGMIGICTQSVSARKWASNSPSLAYRQRPLFPMTCSRADGRQSANTGHSVTLLECPGRVKGGHFCRVPRVRRAPLVGPARPQRLEVWSSRLYRHVHFPMTRPFTMISDSKRS